jgi:hypothetical protein
MNILRLNTTPVFQIVPRKTLTVTDTFKIVLRNESNNKQETILCTITLLANENYNLTLSTFPIGGLNAKFSFTLFNNVTNVTLLLGKLMIISETQSIQDYSNKTNNNYY